MIPKPKNKTLSGHISLAKLAGIVGIFAIAGILIVAMASWEVIWPVRETIAAVLISIACGVCLFWM